MSVLLVFAAQTKADEINVLINTWQQAANELQLSQQKAWLNLLHAEENIWGNVESQVDDDAFFLSPTGKTNMQAELMASIEAFIRSNQSPAAQCRFPARFFLLQQQFKNLPKVNEISCGKFIAWRNKVAANKVTLVFPSMYLNNPGSMFGHTFLRLDNNKKSSLLSYTLSYSARHDKNDGLLVYSYKGITGGYPGYFTTRPYYETLQEYGDIEHRDIWEYDLNLKQDEVDQMMRHLWELSSMNFDYFFLRENCAYRLLAILDVARPSLNLLTKNSFPLYAIPVDTVRAVVHANMVKQTLYRPAITSRLQQMFKQLDVLSQQQGLALANKKQTIKQFVIQQKEPKKQAKIFELASQLRQFKKVNNNNILLARSRIKTQQDTDLFTYQADDPQLSHASTRASLATGQEDDMSFIAFSLRPAFHDLMDSPKGFLDGSAITGLDLRLRWFEVSQKIKLQRVDFFSMTSLSPVTDWSTPLSGKFSIALQRYVLKNDSVTPLTINASLGFSQKYSQLLIYALATSAIDYSTKFEKNGIFYMGAESGALLQMSRSRLKLSWRYLNSIAGLENKNSKTRLAYQYDISRYQALRLEWQKEQYLRNKITTMELSYLYYF